MRWEDAAFAPFPPSIVLQNLTPFSGFIVTANKGQSLIIMAQNTTISPVILVEFVVRNIYCKRSFPIQYFAEYIILTFIENIYQSIS